MLVVDHWHWLDPEQGTLRLVLTASKGPGGWESPIAPCAGTQTRLEAAALYHQVRSQDDLR